MQEPSSSATNAAARSGSTAEWLVISTPTVVSDRRGPRPLSRLIRKMAGRDRRDFCGVFGRSIAAPDHVQVRPQQNQIVAVNVAGDAIGHVEHGHRRAVRANGAFEPVYVRLGAAEF